ncbi:hypothetical protein A9P82_14495 [Arachidicoccus ginsenosidimutans]|uniref:hypothetical protein n=1 Tax=Arachidicoccus sp. BS20 TaxID=1850526 RepID=UPI0007F0E959|nr:hypothetical protein [Arachidicoccus sp. BS20]ANI90390.1 hypothetical protein A9P82_14495 [Arachidicoccus sp. BS20]
MKKTIVICLGLLLLIGFTSMKSSDYKAEAVGLNPFLINATISNSTSEHVFIQSSGFTTIDVPLHQTKQTQFAFSNFNLFMLPTASGTPSFSYSDNSGNSGALNVGNSWDVNLSISTSSSYSLMITED